MTEGREIHRIAIVGGGVAGLAAARESVRCARRPLEVVVCEAADRFGGKALTDRDDDGRPVEWGPDSFLAAKPEAADLARELGLDLVSPGASEAYLWVRGKLRPLPEGVVLGVPTSVRGLVEAVASGILTPAAALRAAAEPWLGRLPTGDVPVGPLLRRRLGTAAAERLAAPLLGGVYGVHPDELGTGTILPQLSGARSMRSAMRRRTTAGGPAFLAPRDGVGRLVEALVASLEGVELRTDEPVRTVARAGAGYRLVVGEKVLEADAVLLAVPAPVAARLLAGVATGAADELAGIQFSASAVARLVYPEGGLSPPPGASGVLVPSGEPGVVAAATYVDSKWPHLGLRSPTVRAIVTDPVALELRDDDLVRHLQRDVGRVLGTDARPTDVRLHRWEHALPIYAPGHRERVRRAFDALPDGIGLAGASLDGVGIPDCIRTGAEAARRLVADPQRPG